MPKHFGKCALCGKECELTYEHIPPRSAFNKEQTKMYTGNELLADGDRLPWETDGLKYINCQQGAGAFTLCKDCNNITGKWYGNSYRYVAYNVAHAIIEWADDPEAEAIGIKDVYPLRFIKQVLSMFCSINNHVSINGYLTSSIPQIDKGQQSPLMRTMIESQIALKNAAKNMDELRAFVLSKDAVGLDKEKFKICMYLTKSNIYKLNGLTANLKLEENSYIVLSEITAYPFGFILYFNPPKNFEHQGIDITEMADIEYGQKGTVEFPFDLREMNTYFPNDYRTKDKIREDVEKANQWVEEHQE